MSVMDDVPNLCLEEVHFYALLLLIVVFRAKMDFQ